MSSHTFTFYYFNDSVQLKVWNRYEVVYKKYYPQTYTVEECLEDYCDTRGRGYVSHYIRDHEDNGLQGTFDFSRSMGVPR